MRHGMALPRHCRCVELSPALMPVARATPRQANCDADRPGKLDDVSAQYAKELRRRGREGSAADKVEIYRRASWIDSRQRRRAIGAIQCHVVAPEFLVGIDEAFRKYAAPGW